MSNSDQSESSPSRRRFLIGTGAAVVVAGGVGAALGVLTDSSPKAATPPNPPADLSAAVAAEQSLLALVDAAIAARIAPASRLALIRSNHSAHLTALQAALAVARGASPTGSGSPTTTNPPAATPTLPGLVAAEKGASKNAAAAASRLFGDDAALLASIAACAACHADLLG